MIIAGFRWVGYGFRDYVSMEEKAGDSIFVFLFFYLFFKIIIIIIIILF